MDERADLPWTKKHPQKNLSNEDTFAETLGDLEDDEWGYYCKNLAFRRGKRKRAD